MEAVWAILSQSTNGLGKPCLLTPPYTENIHSQEEFGMNVSSAIARWLM